MKEIYLIPYPGKLQVYRTKKKYQKAYKKLFKKGINLEDNIGRTDYHYLTDTYLVWANDAPTMAHEVSHTILFLFGRTGMNPIESNGEPFCYLLSHILRSINSE